MDTPDEKDAMYLENDILPTLAGTDQVNIYSLSKTSSKNHKKFTNHHLKRQIINHIKIQARVFQTTNWWSPVKTAASAIYANRHYLGLYRLRNPERLAGNEMYSNGNGAT